MKHSKVMESHFKLYSSLNFKSSLKRKIVWIVFIFLIIDICKKNYIFCFFIFFEFQLNSFPQLFVDY